MLIATPVKNSADKVGLYFTNLQTPTYSKCALPPLLTSCFPLPLPAASRLRSCCTGAMRGPASGGAVNGIGVACAAATGSGKGTGAGAGAMPSQHEQPPL